MLDTSKPTLKKLEEKVDIFKDHENHEVDINKLYNYISIEFRVTDVPSWKTTSSKWRQCTANDFIRNKIQINDENREFYEKRICPKYEEISDYWVVKNGYTNMTSRTSFEILILKCNSDNHDGICADDAQLDIILSNLFFTIYYSTESTEFTDIENLTKRPLRS